MLDDILTGSGGARPQPRRRRPATFVRQKNPKTSRFQVRGDGDSMYSDIVGDDLVGDDLVGEMLDLAGDDLVGDDLVGDDLVGARRRRMARAVARRPGIARPPLINRLPGVSAPAAGKLPLGFGVTTIAAGGSAGTATARPQVPWRGQKLIIGIAGVNAGNYAVTVSPQIGNRPVLAGAAAVDARSFPANGLGNEVMAEAAQAGIDVTLQFAVTPVVGAGDSVICTATWIGDAIV